MLWYCFFAQDIEGGSNRSCTVLLLARLSYQWHAQSHRLYSGRPWRGVAHRGATALVLGQRHQWTLPVRI